MRRCGAAGAVGAAVLLLAGCAATSRVPAEPASRNAPSYSPSPLVTPTPQPGEVARSTLEEEATGRLPAGTQRITVEVACTGPDASTVTWRLETAAGRPLGLGDAQDCTGPSTSSTLALTGAVPSGGVRVALTAVGGAASAWAVVTAGR